MANPQHRLSDEEFQNNTRHLDGLIKEFEALPYPEVQEKVFELLKTIDLLHREALSRLVEFVEQQGQASLLQQAAQDTSVQILLELYDLLPRSPQEQVINALEDLGEYMTGLGCLVELLSVEEGVVHLRLSGSCQANEEVDKAARQALEEVLREGFAGFRSIEFHDPVVFPAAPPARSIIPLERLRQTGRKLNRPVFTSVAPLTALPPGGLMAVEAERQRLLVCQVEGEIYAFHNACPGSPLPLEMGKLEGYSLHCPWHGCVFDIRSGKRLDGGGSGRLVTVPATVRDSMIQLALKTTNE